MAPRISERARNTSREIHRHRDLRRLIVALLSGTIVLGSASELSREKHSTTSTPTSDSIRSRAPQQNSEFTGLPGDPSVNWKITGNPRVFVHLRQAHISPETVMDFDDHIRLMKEQSPAVSIPDELIAELKALAQSYRQREIGVSVQVQEDIYKILQYDVENRGLQRVYVEGLTVEQAGDDYQTYRKTFSQQNPQEQALMADKCLTHVDGATGRLFCEGGIDVSPAETEAARETAAQIEIATGEVEGEADEVRENAAVHLVGESSCTECVVVFGTFHDFGNNITAWNEAVRAAGHEDKTMNLVEITPASASEVDRLVHEDQQKAAAIVARYTHGNAGR